MDEFVSTALLLGIIDKTKNFQNSRAKPSSFTIASELISRGAKKDEISRILWKTKPLPLLQLAGRASVRSRLEEEKHILWSVLTQEDFEKTGTNPKAAIPFVLDHIEEHFSLPEVFSLLWQDPEDHLIRAVLNTKRVMQDKSLEPCNPREYCYNLKQTFTTFQEAEEAVIKLLVH